MAKFELSVYDVATGEVAKTHKRNFMPVDLYIRFQKFSEKVTSMKFKTDIDFFVELKDLILEVFPDMTADEYLKQTDVAEVVKMFGDILTKATEFTAGDSKTKNA